MISDYHIRECIIQAMNTIQHWDSYHQDELLGLLAFVFLHGEDSERKEAKRVVERMQLQYASVIARDYNCL